MENKGKGKVIVIVILLLIVLGLSGYLGYHMLVEDVKVKEDNKKEVERLKEQIKTLKKEVSRENEKTEESDTVKVRKMFIDYLENSKEKPLDYKINNIDIVDDNRKNIFGYEETDVVANVTFSVKVKDIKSSDWLPANGDPDLTTNWINNKSIFVLVKNNKMSVIGTGL